MKQIYIVGIGMGNPETLTLGGKKCIEKSQALIGARRMVDSFPQENKKKYYSIAPEEIVAWIYEQTDIDSISVLMSGDVGFFSGTKKLCALLEEKNKERCTEGKSPFYKVECIAGISSLQYFCSKLNTSWEDAKIVSLHGREANVAGTVQTNEKTFFLTGSDHPAQDICKRLIEAGLGRVEVAVGERLSYETERIVIGSAEELGTQSFDSLSVVLVQNNKIQRRQKQSYGFSDDNFLRGDVPMTKEEVRSVSLSKLQILKTDVIYDVGAGTGSVSVEMALLAEEGQVYAVETNPEAVELIRSNREKFGAWNLQICAGKAPEALDDLPKPDKAFLGGTKGNMGEIVSLLVQKNPQIRIVINAIALESMWEAMQVLKKYGFEHVEIVQLSLAKAREVGSLHMMTGQNPIFIISSQKGQ